MVDKTVSFDNPDGGVIKFDVTNVVGIESYGCSVNIAFHQGSPAAVRYGEDFRLSCKHGFDAEKTRDVIRDIVSTKKEEVDLFNANQKTNCCPPNQWQFNQVAPTVGRGIGKAIAVARNLGKKFSLRH